MSAANLLTALERHAPALAPRLKKWFVEYLVPANRALGIRIDEVAPDSSRVVLSLPRRRRNLNVGGTVHGAAIMALAETVHGVAVLWQFPPAQHRMVTKTTRLEFVAPARSGLRTTFSLSPEARGRIDADLAASGRCEIELESSVTDGGGKEVARLVARYQIRRVGASTTSAAPS